MTTAPENTPRVPRPLGYAWAEPGAEVLLLRSAGYDPTRSNPVSGSIHECRGIIHTLTHTAHDPDARPVDVNWANSTSNSYFFEDLTPLPKQYRRWTKNPSTEVEKKEKRKKLSLLLCGIKIRAKRKKKRKDQCSTKVMLYS